MQIALIAAMTEAGVIGKENSLPWDLPEELKYFREMTRGKPVIMGRKTFESIGKALPHRLNIILTTSADFKAADCVVVNSIDAALHAAKDHEEVMVIGGAKIYEGFLPYADRLYLTFVHKAYSGDTYFPSIHWVEWEKVKEQKGEVFTTTVFERRNQP